MVRLSHIAAMTGLAETVDAAAKLLPSNNLKSFRQYLKEAHDVHRGSQCQVLLFAKKLR